ncbi:MAG: mechanosensitive ion channel family protein [Candidatus Krumholzibacteriia bacterium]
MDRVLEYLARETLLGISLQQYVLAFAAILLSVLLRRIFSSLVIRTLRRFAARTATQLDDMLLDAIGPPVSFAFILAGIYAAAVILDLPQEPVDVRTSSIVALQVALVVDVTWLLIRLVDAFAAFLATAAGRTESKLDDQLIPIVRKSLKTFIGLLAFVFIVQNLGYSVGSLLAGLGIGGLALALAAKDTLSNFFGSLAILIDRPFAVGDWIQTSADEGVVEEIGFRSTRIRTFAKTQISVPNAVLSNTVVNNWSRMPIRRVKMVVGVTYESNASQMEKAVAGIRNILRGHKEIYQDFFLVNFTDFGASSLDIFVYYFTTTTVWDEYLRIRQEINIAIMKLVESLGMEMAFPTRTIYHKHETAAGEPPAAA